MKKPSLRLFAVGLAAALSFAACGGGEPSTTSGSSGSSGEKSAKATIAMATSNFGEILTDAEGRTLYMFEPDEGTESVCYGECADAWPALSVDGDSIAGTGLDQALLGTTERKDGTQQMTYNDFPLYYFAFDEKSGDVNGQGSGDVWWVLSPEGEPIENPGTIRITEAKKLGDILTDAKGRTLYMFEPDKGTESACYGGCAEAWPALPARGDTIAGARLDLSLLGTTERKDGTQQVTYNGFPLYYFAFDEKAGDVNGQGSDDVWWVLSPEGKPIRG
ncbi:MAG: SCO0930 family lipoprotein [Actinomycetota bacterium]